MSYLTNSYILNSSIYGSIDYFVIKVKTDNSGTTASNQINIPTSGAGYNCSIDFGDGTGWQVYSGTAPTITYTYSGSGTYTIKIKENVNGGFPRIYYNGAGDRLKLLSIEQWGSIHWTNFNTAFAGCSNLVINATDKPITNSVISMAQAFLSCTSLISIDLSGCNFSLCTSWSSGNILGAFYGCTSLTTINMSGVTMRTSGTYSMQSLCQNCTSLTSIIGWNSLNLSKCTSFQNAFTSSGISTFDWSGLNISSCTSLISAFQSMSNLTSINFTGVTLGSNVNMQSMFNSSGYSVGFIITGFNTLDGTKITSLNSFATSSKLTSIDISGMNLSNCTTMLSAFSSASLLTTVDMTNVNLSACTSLANLFSSCTALTSVTMTGMTLNSTSNFSASAMFDSVSTNTTITITGIDTLNWSKCNNFTNFMRARILDTTTYSALLNNLNAGVPVSSLTFNGGGSTYNSSAITSRANLIATYLWTITDGGLV